MCYPDGYSRADHRVGERRLMGGGHAAARERMLVRSANHVPRPERGRPRLRPTRVIGDKKGYSSRKIRAYLRRCGIRYTMPRQTNERRTGPFDRALYRERNLVERLINRFKQPRRLATRYEKRADN